MREAAAEKDRAKRRAALAGLADRAEVARLPPYALTRLARRLWAVGDWKDAVTLLWRPGRCTRATSGSTTTWRRPF